MKNYLPKFLSFYRLTKICSIFLIGLVLNACTDMPEDEISGDELTAAILVSSTFITDVYWEEESNRLNISGIVSGNERKVSIFNDPENNQRTFIGSADTRRDGSWRLILPLQSNAEVPCSIYAKSKRVYQKKSVSNAPSNCGAAYTANKTQDASIQRVLDGKITTSTSDLDVFVGGSMTFSATTRINAVNMSDNQEISDDDEEEGKENRRSKTRTERSDSNDDDDDDDNSDSDSDSELKTNNNENINLRYIWDFGSYAPKEQGPSTTMRFTRAGTVTVKLFVEDSAGNIDATPDSVVINVYDVSVNSEPNGKINAQISNSGINVGESVSFSGTGTDPENNRLNYSWNFGRSGIAASRAQNPGSVQFNKAGTFTVTLIVTDDKGLSDSTPDTFRIKVNPVNLPPNGNIITPNIDRVIAVGEQLTFDGNGTDPEIMPINYLWDFDDSGIPRSTNKKPGQVTFNKAGIFYVTLTVTDNEGLRDSTPSQIRVIVNARDNRAPNGKIQTPTSNTTINVGQSISFSGNGSDPDGDDIRYRWNFSNSGISDKTNRNPGSLTFNKAGTFTVALTVVDKSGLADPTPAIRNIVVKEATNNAPNGKIVSPVPSTSPIGSSVTVIKGSALSFKAIASDPDGDTNLRYSWDFGSYMARVSGQNVNVTFDTVGRLTVGLIVRDSQGLYDPTIDTVAVNVVDQVINSEPNGTITSPLVSQNIQVGDVVNFASSGFDPEGKLLSYFWSFGNSGVPDSNIQNPGSVQFNKTGSFNVSLTVKDDRGVVDSTPATVKIIVSATVNAAPNGNIDAPIANQVINAGETITFFASGTSLNGSFGLMYMWDFGSYAPRQLGQSVSMRFENPGEVNVKLFVKNEANLYDPTPDERLITVVDNGATNFPVKQVLDPSTQTQFVNPLPIPAILPPVVIDNYESYVLRMTEFKQDLGIKDPISNETLMTTVWGYGGSYPGPTIHARSTLPGDEGLPTKILWLNDLPDKHILPVDPTLRCGPNAPNCQPEVRTVPHLHGAHVEADSDGHPDAWFTNDFEVVGHKFKRYMNGVYTYRNDQEAASLWYHDHAMGATRLNVYAGLAGFYIMHDENEDRLYRQHLLPNIKYDIPLLLQDRSFYTDGSLGYELGVPVTFDPISGEGDPSVVPEYYGDMMLANGKIWPKLDVEPRIYRFRVLNGSNSRFMNIRLSAGFEDIPFYIIGSDGGLLDKSVKRVSSLLGPAERIDILVDFSDPKLQGKSIMMTNDANSPYPNGDPVLPGITDRIMMFNVSLPLDNNVRLSTIPTDLRTTNIPELTPTPGVVERELLLSEGMDRFGRLMPQLGTSLGGSMLWSDPVTETPVLGTTEIWKLINNTEDAHPVHQHLVQFRIVERQAYDVASYVPGDPSSLVLIGAPRKPSPEESGWKDTVVASPGEIVRIIANYDLLGEYVWHCHILEHEDHEMMRPFTVIP